LGESLAPSALAGLACVVVGVAAMMSPAKPQHLRRRGGAV
jgi:hypothetical protein